MEAELNPGVALLYGLLWPGLGQLYNCQPRQALVLFVLYPLTTAAFFWLAWQGGLLGMGVGWLLPRVIWLGAALAACGHAIRTRFAPKAPYRRPAILLPFGFGMMALFYLTLILTTESWPVRTYYFPSGSMAPTLVVGDYVTVDRWRYRTSQPQRGDIVLVGRSASIIKRVVGLPGDRLAIRDGHLYRDNSLVEESYVHGPTSGVLEEVTVPPDSIYVMGDDRDNSTDSRSFGPVPLSQLGGKAIYIFWPPGRMTRF